MQKHVKSDRWERDLNWIKSTPQVESEIFAI